ncbi:MAG: hypothetical protein AB8B57_02510 [Congregibacter sp.]
MRTVISFSITLILLVAWNGARATDDAEWDFVFSRARVIDPESGLNAVRDVAVKDGRIAAIKADLDAAGAKVINAQGHVHAPGFIDLHAHGASGASM